MTAPLALAGLWLLGAALAPAPAPGRWRRAAVLVCLGVPLLGWLTVEHGPVAGLLALAAGAAALRWPAAGLWRRPGRAMTRPPILPPMLPPAGFGERPMEPARSEPAE